MPVIDHYWQTETGWPVAANCLGIERFPVVPGSPTRAVPGWDVHVLDANGDELPAGRDRRARRQAADAARLLADALERGGALPRDVPLGVPWLLPDRRRRLRRRERLRLRHGPHRRHHQHRRPPPLDRRDGGGAGGAPGRRRVRGDRRRRRPQGPAPGRLPRPEGRRRAPARGDRRGGRATGARPDRPGRGIQDRGRRRRLPKTRSGKILRGTMRRIADGEPYTTPATIDDPIILDEVGDALRTIGYAQPEVPVSSA